MSLKSILISGLALTLGLAVAVVGAETKNKPTIKPYPLKTCVVSGDKLGDMGDIHVIQYKGRDVRFCCPDCEKDFRKAPKKYLDKLDAAEAAATQPSTKLAAPMDQEHQPGHEHSH